jgi:hypothetical protein
MLYSIKSKPMVLAHVFVVALGLCRVEGVLTVEDPAVEATS